MPCGILTAITRTSLLLSKYLQKYVIKKTNKLALLSIEGDPIHCMITNQTKYSEPLNLVLSKMITSFVEKCSIWFVFWITDSGDVVVSLKKTLKANMNGINIAKLEKNSLK